MNHLRQIIKVASTTTIGNATHPVGSITTFLYKGDLPKGWLEPDGRVYTREQYPEFWDCVGKTYVPQTREGTIKRLVRRLFKLPGPEDGLRSNEGRLPDIRPPLLLKKKDRVK